MVGILSGEIPPAALGVPAYEVLKEGLRERQGQTFQQGLEGQDKG